MVDPLRGEVFRYSPGGAFLGPTPPELRSAMKNLPSDAGLARISIGPTDGDLLIEASRRFLHLDSDFLPFPSADFTDEPQNEKRGGGPSARLRHLYQWQREQRRGILGLADILPDSPKPKEATYAFITADLSDPSHFQTLKTWHYPTEDAAEDAAPDKQITIDKDFYRIGLPFIATIDTTSYVVVFDHGEMKLWRHSPGDAEFDETPLAASAFAELVRAKNLKAPEHLPHLTDTDRLKPVMEAVEAASMPVGLYSQGRYLYVLYRQPGPNPWHLGIIDPDKPEGLVGSLSLPSHAPHLMAVPGPTWAFIEKGSVEGWQKQAIYGMFTVPSEAINKLRGCS